MFSYIVRKILSTIPTLFGVTLVIFILFNLVGGNPALMMLGRHATAAQIAEVNHQYGYDLPKYQQYFHYLKEVVTFDYGRSYQTKQQINTMIVRGIMPSLSITVPALLLTTLLAVSIGLIVSYFRGKAVDRIAVVLCILGMSISILAYILFGQYFFAYKMGWFPISGYEPTDPFQYAALPALILVTVGLGYDVRFYRTALLEEINQDYVRTARAKGVSERSVLFKHVLRNGMTPIVTNVVIQIPLLIMGVFLLEGFFGIPGLGGITIDAINNSDFPVIKAMATLDALLLILGNMMTDIVYSWVDPRVSLK
jgi:peptide/nickel transport system permease protein